MRTYVMLGVLVGLAAGEARADVPGLLHYQGYLTDVEGTPVSGVWTVTFGLYTQQSGGTAFFAESQVVEPDVGVFSVLLGTQPGNSIDPGAFAGGAVWLQLTVNDGETPPVSLMPRQRVAAHPYAMWTDSAGTCDEAADAAALGGVPAASYALKTALTGLVDEDDLPALLALLGFTPGGSYGDDDVQAYLDLIGITPGGGGYGDPDVADYLAMNGFEPGPYFDGTWASLSGKPDFVTHAELADFVVTEDILDEVAESGLFLMADGSVVASGDLDLGGNELLDVVIENASAASPPTGPKQGQLWFDTTAKALKVYNGTQWIALGSGGGSVNDLQCNGCVDASDVSFGYAGAPAQGGAAFSAMGLVCQGCVEASDLNVSWALGKSPGGAAAGLDCNGCVTVGHIASAALQAASHTYSNTASGLTATNVQAAIDELADAGPLSVQEGNGTIVSYVGQWGLPAYGNASQYVHLLNPTNPKVISYLYGEEDQSFASSNNLVVTSAISPNKYMYNVTGTAGQLSLTATSNANLAVPGDQILIYQIVGIGGNGQNAGKWELNSVASVSGNTVNLTKPLVNSYTDSGPSSGQAQAVIASSYNNLEVASGGIVRPASYLDDNADYGGIVYIRARTITVKNGGKVHADGYGFNSIASEDLAGDSECRADNLNQRNPNCSGGGGGYNSCNCGGGGGGNQTAGANASSSGCSSFGMGGLTKGDAAATVLTMGGAGGNADCYYNSSQPYGHGGGLVVLGAQQIVVEAGGAISSNGSDGQSSYNGAGAGGTVALFAGTIVNNGTLEAKGGKGHVSGSYFGGDGGAGWIHQKGLVPGVANVYIPRGVRLEVDGLDITQQVGDPNGKGTPHWDATAKAWGFNGVDAWSSGPLDLTAAANWTLGEHRIQLKETGGAGGDLKLYTYVVYPFSSSSLPSNDTCTSPAALDLMGAVQPLVISGTTEDIMGKIKATDNYVQAGCGGSGGPDVVYSFTLTEWRRLTIDVNAPFDPKVYIRKTSCTAGDMVACGGAHLVTDDLKNGTYYLFVDGSGNLQKGNFTLSILASPPSPPSNDTCSSPMPLVIQNGVAQKYGVSLFSNDNYSAGCGGTGGLDNVYSFEVPPGTTQASIAVQATFQPVLYLSKASCTGPYIACAPSSTYSIGWPEAGTYYLVLDGKTPSDKGEYTITVTLQ